jgi:two-component system, response regulator, stage 0 sporulation protein F
MSMNEILTAQELSTYLKITTTTIYKLAQQGEIPSFKIGSEWRFKRELIDRWLENGAGHAPKKVLVVDDEPTICDLYLRALDKKKYAVDVVYSGPEAIGAVSRNNYDFIFLDLKMPGMNGVEAFKEIKKQNVRSIVVIVTAYPDSELLVDAMKLGPLTVILKPFDLGEIQKSIESLVLMTSKV